MDEVYEECINYDIRVTEDDFSDTVSSPSTPMSPSTPCTPASDHDTDKSGFSVSLDSGIGSPSPYNLRPNVNQKIIDMHNLRKNGKKDTARKMYKTDHVNKEKHRRERIKDSCDQLRVLLPYIRGRKTDMASILEMAVDYLRIVNMCMPGALHTQIIDFLSKDENLVPDKESKVRGKKGASKSTGKSTVPLCEDIAQLEEKTTGSQKKNSKEMNLSEIASSCDILSNKCTRLQTDESNGPESFHLDARLEPTYILSNKRTKFLTDESSGPESFHLDARLEHLSNGQANKRAKLQTDESNGPESFHFDARLEHLSNGQANKRAKLQTDESNGPESFHFDARLEPTLAGHTDLVPHSDQSNSLCGKSYAHHEEKTYSRVYSGTNYSDGFNAAQQIFNTYTANKSSFIEASPYRPGYSTDPALYHYYPNLVPNMSPQNHHYTTSSDLVSPSNVLSSLSYSSHHSRLENVTMLSDATNKED